MTREVPAPILNLMVDYKGDESISEVQRVRSPVAAQQRPAARATPSADASKIVGWAACAAVAATAVQVVLLGLLHVLSPEYEPGWRVISEYANGDHGRLLSLSFVAGGCAAWALAIAVWSQGRSRTGKVGLFVLLVAGAGPVAAAVFDINHPIHDVVGLLGTLGLAVAALLVGVALSRTEPWATYRKILVWTAQLPWISLALFVATTVLLAVTFAQAGGEPPPDGQALPVGTPLPEGTVAINGWFNRLIIVAGGAWVATVASLGIVVRRERA